MADDKAKSIGIRKVVGASRTELIKQVLAESGVFNILAVAIGLLLVHLLLPFYSNSFGIPLDYSALYDLQTFIGLAGFIFFSTIIAGFYPAFIISAINPLKSIVNKASSGNGFTFRKVLVVSQFFAATILMIVTVVAYRQLSFMRSKELGINIDRVVVDQSAEFRQGNLVKYRRRFCRRFGLSAEVKFVQGSAQGQCNICQRNVCISPAWSNCQTGALSLRRSPLIPTRLIACWRWELTMIFSQPLK